MFRKNKLLVNLGYWMSVSQILSFGMKHVLVMNVCVCVCLFVSIRTQKILDGFDSNGVHLFLTKPHGGQVQF